MLLTEHWNFIFVSIIYIILKFSLESLRITTTSIPPLHRSWLRSLRNIQLHTISFNHQFYRSQFNDENSKAYNHQAFNIEIKYLRIISMEHSKFPHRSSFHFPLHQFIPIVRQRYKFKPSSSFAPPAKCRFHCWT